VSDQIMSEELRIART